MRHILIGFFAAATLFSAIDLVAGTDRPVPQFSPEEVALCEAEGGCVIVTNAFLKQVAQEIGRLRSLLNKSCA